MDMQRTKEKFLKLFRLVDNAQTPWGVISYTRDLTQFIQDHFEVLDRMDMRWAISYSLPNMCYQKHIIDPRTILGVLQCVFKAMVCFRYLPFNVVDVNEDCVVYFLRCAMKNRFVLYGQRITELYTENRKLYFQLWMMHAKQDLILTLFQYGARFVKHNIGHSLSDFYPMMYFICQGHRNDLWSETTLQVKTDLFEKDSKIMRMWNIIRILMRSIQNPNLVTYLVAGRICDRINFSFHMRQIPEINILAQFYDCVFPKMNFGRLQPSSLKHICRFTIRERLYENWALPEGIEKLNTPQHFKKYLNLLYD